MAERITLARPYAKAVFEIAAAQKSYELWTNQLKFLVEMVQNPKVIYLLHDQSLPIQEVIDLFLTIGENILDTEGQNLVRTMAKARRLGVLPEVAQLFEQFRCAAEQMIHVEFISAVPVTEEQKKGFPKILEKYLSRSVEIHYSVDPNLLGGFMIRANDDVIDASIRGNLVRLKETMGGQYGFKSV